MTDQGVVGVAGGGHLHDAKNSSLMSVAVVICIWSAALIMMSWSTVAAMAHTWFTAETYTHGVVVAPISLWLLWRMRHELMPLVANGPSPLLILILPPAALLQMAGELAFVQVVAQFAFVATLVVGLALLMGLPAARVAAFPLLFLFMMVPVGSSLEPAMMDLTAEYTVRLIQLTGIPVYQEGRFFQLPTGSWSVVEACSGVRYLIASATLGLIYAHLSYHSLWKKVLFVALSFVVPVVANVLRAYLIVMLGHLSGMELATGVDHLIYGWIFFGLVMLLLFWLGGLWADPSPETVPTNSTVSLPLARTGVARLLLFLALTISAVFLTRASMLMLDDRESDFELAPTQSFGNELWSCGNEVAPGWKPRATDVDRRLSFSCVGSRPLSLFADQYTDQWQGREVSRFDTGLKGEDGDRWRVIKTRSVSISIGGHRKIEVEESLLRRNRSGQMVLVWLWYQVDARPLGGASSVKFAELSARMRGAHRVSSRVYLSMPIAEESEVAAARAAGEEMLGALGEAILAQLGVRH